MGSSEGSVKVDGSSSDGRNKARITDSDSFVVAVFLFFFLTDTIIIVNRCLLLFFWRG